MFLSLSVLYNHRSVHRWCVTENIGIVLSLVFSIVSKIRGLGYKISSPTLLVKMKASLKEIWRNQILNSGDKMNTFSHSESPHNKETNNITIPCCKLLVRTNDIKHLGVSFNEPKPRRHLRNGRVSLLWLKMNPIALFKGDLLPNFNNTVERELLVEFNNSIPPSASHVLTYTLGLI